MSCKTEVGLREVIERQPKLSQFGESGRI